MQIFPRNRIFYSIVVVSSTIFVLSGCQSAPTTTVNTNSPAANSTNTNSAMTNTNSAATNSTNNELAAVETKEPEQYQATVTLKAETGGSQTSNFPPLTAQVARSGANKRMEFSLPTGEKVVYLDLGERHLLISPARKQYAELNKESLGMDIRGIMTPAQIVSQAKNLKGVQRVGEEQVNGRDAVKYSYDSITDTKSQAGNVETKSFIYIDKETGLPLRSDSSAQSQNGSVNGMSSLHLVTEMSNISTTVDPSLFAEPTDYKKVEPSEIRGQLETVFKFAGVILEQLMKNQSAPSTANSNSAATPSPTASPR